MKRMNMRAALAYAAALVVGGAGCATDLAITNPNNPDVDRALATPDDVRTLGESALNVWYKTSQWQHPWFLMGVTADVMTGNFGNFGMRFNNLEPRIAYENSSAGGDRAVTEDAWDYSYRSLGQANDVLRSLRGGLSLGGANQNAQARALAFLVQGGSLANLAIIFDRAFIVDETATPGGTTELQPYRAVATAAVARFDSAIAAVANVNANYAASVFPLASGTFSTASLRAMANTFAARTLAYTPRSTAESQQVDWARVQRYAESGISQGAAPFDISVAGDGTCSTFVFNTIQWCSMMHYYANEPSWVRTDMRVIALMDSTQPTRFTGTVPPQARSADARLASDFQFNNNVIGDPGRGVWMQTPYSYQRYRFYARTQPNAGRGNAPWVLRAENDLLLAEALVRQNRDLARAAELINRTRVGRGQLRAATASDNAATLLRLIDYERQIELYGTSGVELPDGRRFGRLQRGTLLQLPIPAKELETLGLPVYTFGGAAGSAAP